MKATLVSYTHPIGDLGHLTPEEFIAYQARVSSPQNQDKHDTAFKLLSYCLRNGHWSVFDMVDVTFEIETSRAIMAQVLRHWSFRFQEFSQRYATVGDCQPVEIRVKHEGGNRQGSAEVDYELSAYAASATGDSFGDYQHLLNLGAAPECARFVLPLATTTRAYMKGSVRSWITYFWQRLDGHAQKEHRELAELIFAKFKVLFPAMAQLVTEGRMRYLSDEDMAILEEAKQGKLKLEAGF